MRFNFILLFLLWVNTLFAQEIIEPCKFGQPLIDALQTQFTPSNPLGYGPARDILYSEIDNDGLELSGIYTNFTVTLTAGADPSMSAFDGGINAEHVFPQSLGAGDEPMRSDLHNIFPSKENVNASRGNCQFGEIEDNDTDNWFFMDSQMSNTPSSNIDDYSEKDEEDCYFEPREVVKGDIARAVFYFYAIYQDEANDNFFNQQKEILYQWHQMDPVDEKEGTRNVLIAAEQGNENPFISDSTLVRRAFFEADASYPEGDDNCYSATTPVSELGTTPWVRLKSNFIQNELIIQSTRNNGSVSLVDLQGRTLREELLSTETILDLSNLISGIYILRIYSEGQEQIFKIYKK